MVHTKNQKTYGDMPLKNALSTARLRVRVGKGGGENAGASRGKIERRYIQTGGTGRGSVVSVALHNDDTSSEREKRPTQSNPGIVAWFKLGYVAHYLSVSTCCRRGEKIRKNKGGLRWH